MPRYIDAEPYKDMYIGKVFGVTIKAAKNLSFGDFHGEDFVKVANINEIPTADVQEVKHGKWVEVEKDVFECSHCKRYRIHGCSIPEPRYCGNCGAKMNLEDER